MTQQQTVVDHQSIKTPNSVGVLPPNSIDEQPPYVWWIATGLFDTGSSLSSNEGGIYLMSMTRETWGNFLKKLVARQPFFQFAAKSEA